MLYLKRHLTAYRKPKKICFTGSLTRETICFDYNKGTRRDINKLITNGISWEEVKTNKIFSELHERNFLTERNFLNGKKDINRNHLFFNYINDNVDKSKISKICDYSILVFGAGGAGGTLTYMLGQFGFKRISIVDFDVIENSDVLKSSHLQKKDISKKKIEVLKEGIKANFDISISVYDGSFSEMQEIEDLVSVVKPDFVFNACDPKPSFKLYLNDVCFKYQVPFMNLSYSYELLLVGPIYVPTVTSCEHSLNELSKKVNGPDEDFLLIHRTEEDYFVHPATSIGINMLASLVLKEAVFFFLEEYDKCQTIGKKMFFDILTFKKDILLAECTNNCSFCSMRITV